MPTKKIKRPIRFRDLRKTEPFKQRRVLKQVSSLMTSMEMFLEEQHSKEVIEFIDFNKQVSHWLTMVNKEELIDCIKGKRIKK